MKLYHNGMSTCSQKVRMVLAEKGLDFESQIIDLQKGDQFSSDYLKLNPTALVPTLEDDGNIYIDSSLINEYLDDAYVVPALKPSDANELYRMRSMIRKIDDIQHPACGVITYAIGLRPIMLKKDPKELQLLIDQVKNPERRENRRSVMTDGIMAPIFRTALLEYVDVLKSANDMLGNNAWLAGDIFSLADCALVPYALRIEHLGQLAILDQYEHLSSWWKKVQTRPSYKTAVADLLPEKAVAMFTAGGLEVQQQVADMI